MIGINQSSSTNHRPWLANDLVPAHCHAERQQQLLEFQQCKIYRQMAMTRGLVMLVRWTDGGLWPDRQRGRAADIFFLGCVYSETLTVFPGKPLDEYQQSRRAPSNQYPLAFRANLPGVRRWLSHLTEGRSSKIVDTLLYQI